MPNAVAERSEQEPAEIISLERRKADKFLDLLTSAPFIAVVVDGETVRFFARADIEPEQLALIRQTIEEMET